MRPEGPWRWKWGKGGWACFYRGNIVTFHCCTTPFYLENEQLLQDDAETGKWESLLGVSAADEPSFVLLPDPFSFDAQRFLGGLDRHFAASTKVGGLASGGQESGVNTMFLTDGTRDRGLVGLAMSGNITVDTIVAQGCRPIGEPMFVTGCRGNLLLELDGRPARDILRELFHGLPARDQQLISSSFTAMRTAWKILRVSSRPDSRWPNTEATASAKSRVRSRWPERARSPNIEATRLAFFTSPNSRNTPANSAGGVSANH